jgi:hypothetical protein
MSDLRPRGVEVELGGQKHRLLFTINAIDQIQETCNLPLYEALHYVAKAADGNMEHEVLVKFKEIVTILLNDENDGDMTEQETGKLLQLENYKRVAVGVLNAYGFSIPDPDEDDDLEEDDDDPKAETGL